MEEDKVLYKANFILRENNNDTCLYYEGEINPVSILVDMTSLEKKTVKDLSDFLIEKGCESLEYPINDTYLVYIIDLVKNRMYTYDGSLGFKQKLGKFEEFLTT